MRARKNKSNYLDSLVSDLTDCKMLRLRILELLHHVTAPSCIDQEGLLGIISRLKQLPSADALLWVTAQEKFRADLRQLYEARDTAALGELILTNYAGMFCFDSDAKYENILHQSVRDDYVQCTALLTGPYIEELSTCINQPNYQGNAPFHLAAKLLKIAHLRLLIRSPQVDLTAVNKDKRNILHLLLISLQKRWFTEKMKAIVEKRMYSRTPPPTEIVSLISEILQRMFLGNGLGCSALISTDRYQLSVMNYALNLGNISIFGLLAAELRSHYNMCCALGVVWVGLMHSAIKLSMPLDKRLEFMSDVNSFLPEDIRMHSLSKVTKTFNSKMHCSKRRYHYLLPTYMLQDKATILAALNTAVEVQGPVVDAGRAGGYADLGSDKFLGL